MSLFKYTKKISDRIKFYDEITKNPFFGYSNPFSKPINLTIVWIEDEKNSKG